MGIPKYIIVATNEEYFAAQNLFNEYAVAINIDLSFQNFENELNELDKIYNPSDGGIILYKNDSAYIGCVAIRRISESVAELKRMYVCPEFQNFGIGKTLLQKAMGLAVNCKYDFIRLDTLNYMKPAMHLYAQEGFYEIEPYYYNPISTAIFFEKDIRIKE